MQNPNSIIKKIKKINTNNTHIGVLCTTVHLCICIGVERVCLCVCACVSVRTALIVESDCCRKERPAVPLRRTPRCLSLSLEVLLSDVSVP